MFNPKNLFFFRFNIHIIWLGVFVVCLLQCSARFVKREKLNQLKNELEGVYVLLKDIDIGNNQKASTGTKVKLYFMSDSESIKVYAYPHTQPRESALGKNILYLFENDFPKEEWEENFFKKKLFHVVKKIK